MPTGKNGPAPCPSPRQQHQFDFQPTQRLRRPRAWERAPASPFITHPRRRKVWKRHGLSRNKSGQHAHLPRQIGGEDEDEDEDEKEKEKEKGGVESPKNMGARPIKRLRINKKQAALSANDGGLHQKSPVERYITTLHDKAPETPKRKRPLRKSLRPDGFLRKGERKKSQSLEVTTTNIIETCQAVALGKEVQLVDASTTTDTDAAINALDDKGMPPHVETVLAACAKGNDQSSVPCAETSQRVDAVGDDQSNTAGSAIGQSIEAPYDEQYLTPSEILSPTSPTISASTTAYRADELLSIADSNPSEARGGVSILIEIPPQSSSVDDNFATISLQRGTRLNDTNTREFPDASSEQTKKVGRWTRSTPRFSDDTNLLKDFLSRVQAKKAAKDDQSNVSARMKLPRLSPRGVLADVTLSPPQLTELASCPGTSPLKQQFDALDGHGGNDDDDDDEEEEEGEEKDEDEGDNGDESDEKLDGAAIGTASIRRSTRTRLFTPAKTAVITRIPIRRADGTEPIVLQRSEAQALATATRNNTRRNKGQSKPPKLTLKKLPAEAADEVTIAPSRAERGNGRVVGWDEKLVYYLDPSEPHEGDEKRTRVRRLRKLGAVNGTPAPEKVLMEMNSSNEDGTHKGRRKSKGRVVK